MSESAVRFLWPLALLAFLSTTQISRASDQRIEFQCVWGDRAPFVITVDPGSMRATRSDGGKDYSVVKLTKWGVWLAVDDPRNVSAVAIHLIQRGEAVASQEAIDSGEPFPPGFWQDTIMSITGTISPIIGGRCWETRR